MKSSFTKGWGWLICFAVMTAQFLPTATAQTTGNGPSSRITMQGPADQSGGSIIRDASGRQCLDVEAAARAQIVVPELLDHVVSVKNNCPRTIRGKICYFNSDRCHDVLIQGYKRVDTILGTMRGVKFFRYSIVQKYL